MFLAGVSFRPELVEALASLVDDEELALKLRQALERGTMMLALSPDDRMTILAALEDPPAGLEELRAVLLQQESQRRRAES